LDKPDNVHHLGGNFGGIDFFNGFMFNIEIHNIALPQIDIEANFSLGGPTNDCGPL
jgi:hypothetical protein